MPSNDQLKKEITELCVELKLPVNTRGLNNEKLAALLSDLKAKKTDAANVTGADSATAEKEAAEKEAAEKEAAEKEAAEKEAAEKGAAKRRKGTFIAEGKSLTTKRGILGPGQEIVSEDLAGGAEAIAGFVKSKHLVKVA